MDERKKELEKKIEELEQRIGKVRDEYGESYPEMEVLKRKLLWAKEDLKRLEASCSGKG